jgi:hypothetical protein
MPDLPPQFGESFSRNITAHPEKDRGKQVYYAYGCNGCHGDTGLRA